MNSFFIALCLITSHFGIDMIDEEKKLGKQTSHKELNKNGCLRVNPYRIQAIVYSFKGFYIKPILLTRIDIH